MQRSKRSAVVLALAMVCALALANDTPSLRFTHLLAPVNVAVTTGKQDFTKQPEEAKPKEPASKAPPPYTLPTYDGKRDGTKAPPTGEYKLAAAPNAKELFDMVVSCWPERSWLRAELAAESRITRRVSDAQNNTTMFDPVAGQYTTSSAGTDKYVGVVFRIPLFSAIELDKEREREIMRRSKIADGVGEYVTALAEYQMHERELRLMSSLERRAQERVAAGVTETNEQVKYLERVAQLDRSMVGQKARLIKSRMSLQGMCAENKAWLIDEYLKRFKEVE